MNLVVSVDTIMGLCGLAQEKRDAITAETREVCVELLDKRDWHFLEITVTEVTVANQSEYTISGANDNCGKIVDLYYNGYLVDYKDTQEFYRLTKAIETTVATAYSGMLYWTSLPESATEGFPVVKLFGTPTEAGIEMFVVALKRVDVDEPELLIPRFLTGIVMNTMLSRHLPDPIMRRERAMMAEEGYAAAELRDRATTQAWSQGRIDPFTARRNYEINMRSGFTDRVLPVVVE